MTPHNEAKKEDIAKNVIMPGDPLRAKYIAENYLEEYKLVNTVRNMFAYTGNYKGKRITVMASGMGMPSMGIYCYELYKFYDVETIIRVGSCGTYAKDIKMLDTILVDESFTTGNFAYNYSGEKENIAIADRQLNETIEQVANKEKLKITKGDIVCAECFDQYIENTDHYFQSFPKDKNIIGVEMESFALFYTAKRLGKKAACLLTVVDSMYDKKSLTSEEREKSLNDMIKIALESVCK